MPAYPNLGFRCTGFGLGSSHLRSIRRWCTRLVLGSQSKRTCVRATAPRCYKCPRQIPIADAEHYWSAQSLLEQAARQAEQRWAAAESPPHQQHASTPPEPRFIAEWFRVDKRIHRVLQRGGRASIPQPHRGAAAAIPSPPLSLPLPEAAMPGPPLNRGGKAAAAVGGREGRGGCLRGGRP